MCVPPVSQQKTALPRVLPWFRELLERGASTEDRDPTRAMDVPFGMRAGIVTALAGISTADDPSGTVRTAARPHLCLSPHRSVLACNECPVAYTTVRAGQRLGSMRSVGAKV